MDDIDAVTDAVEGAVVVDVPDGEADKFDFERVRRMAGVSSDSRALGSCNCVCRPIDGLCVT